MDIPAGDVHRGALADDGVTIEPRARHPVGQPVGAAVPAADPEDGWLLATELGFAHLAAGGALTTLAEPESPRARGLRMNDGKCDPRGRLWAGSMAYDSRPGVASLYMLDHELEVHVRLRGATISNGMAWTRAGRTMFYIDTPTNRVDRLSLADDGAIVGREAAFSIDPGMGSPDGMAIDREGCLWIALWGGYAVGRFAPGGELLATVGLGCAKVSSCAFGGPELTTLFITTSQEGFTDADRLDQPDAGLVHSVEVPVAGFQADRFAGAVP